MMERQQPVGNGTYKSLTLILASILTTIGFGYFTGERQDHTAVTVLQEQQRHLERLSEKNSEEQSLHDIELDKRLRKLEEEVAEERAKVGLPHRSIAPMDTRKSDRITSEAR
jgi:hypothetical protein